MLHPEVTLIAGKDLKIIKQQLKNFNVGYIVKPFQILNGKTQLLIGGYNWPDDPNKIIYLDDILEGLKLPFFKPEPVELEWNVASCLPCNWTFDDWEIDFDDLKHWNSNFNLIKSDKVFITNIVNKCIHEENETLKIYTETLKPTFLHPDIQTLLNYCVRHKEAHINMWCNIKEKLELENQSPTFIKIKKPATILELAIKNLIEVITREEILEPAATECLAHFTNKGHLVHFIKLVQRRDKESKENADLVKILLFQLEKMYPFIVESINYRYIYQQEYIKSKNNRLKIFQFI